MEIINREKEEGIFSTLVGASAVTASAVVSNSTATKDVSGKSLSDHHNDVIPETTRLEVPRLNYEGDKDLFRLMSFNIRFDTEKDGKNRWCHRSHLIPATIRRHAAHIVGLQEALHSQIKDLENGLPDFSWVGVGRDDGKKAGEYCPIFFKKDQFKCLDSGTFWLSETPTQAGSRGWGARCRRIATWARLIKLDKTSVPTDREVFVVNAHFDHETPTARQESSLLVSRYVPQLVSDSKRRIPSLNYAASSSIPIIVMGDLNAQEHSDTIQLLTNPQQQQQQPGTEGIVFEEARLTSREKYNEKSGTFTDWTPASEERDGCILIDHVLHHGDVRPELYGIICELWPEGRRASDHRPLVTDFRFVSSSSSSG